MLFVIVVSAKFIFKWNRSMPQYFMITTVELFFTLAVVVGMSLPIVWQYSDKEFPFSLKSKITCITFCKLLFRLEL